MGCVVELLQEAVLGHGNAGQRTAGTTVANAGQLLSRPGVARGTENDL
jgi:hypothetical protein